jgi:hypothetical protein|tara:strand:+ start:905 stop:1021 length:117 start_codon:yes stop_codon:yes gene_type:complete
MFGEKIIIVLMLLTLMACSKFDYNPATTIGRMVLQNDS